MTDTKEETKIETVETQEKQEQQTQPQESEVKDKENGEDKAFVVPDDSKVRMSLPLKLRWTIWFLNAHKHLDWTSRLSKVHTFERLEEFVAFYDNIRPPSICLGCDYNLFKEGIEPMWEVPENKEGGRLILHVDKTRPDVLDSLWSELLFALVGNVFGDDTPSICGAVCNIRVKGSKICLWTTNAQDDEANMRIGQIMKGIFKEVQQERGNFEVPVIRYENHEDVQKKSSSKVTERFIV